MNTQPSKPLRHARDYAQAIVDARGDVARQRQIFAACPYELRGLARELAKCALERLESLREHQRLTRRAVERTPPETVPYSPPASKKPERETGRLHLAELRASVRPSSTQP